MCHVKGRRGLLGARGVALGALSGLALLSRGGSSSTRPSAPMGNLSVTITAPAGVTPSVAVRGPGGYQRTLTRTQTLDGLAVGTYMVTAAPVVVANPIVATVYDATVTGGTATVNPGATPVASVLYTARPGSGALWVMNATGSIAAYQAAQLTTSSRAAPASTLKLPPELLFRHAAFDAGGNLWMSLPSEANQGKIVEFEAGQLAGSETPTPAVTLSGTPGTGLAFDAGGNLWVATSNAVVEFVASQLTQSGRPTPAITLTATADSSLSRPVGLAFDARGDLWVANALNPSTVVEFAASQLTANGSPTPAVTLSPDSTGESLTGLLGLAFDARGNLWVANSLNGTLVEFAVNQLAESGSPTPAITLITPGGSMFQLAGLAFDASGNLWVAGYPREYGKANTVAKFAVSQFVRSGSPTPQVILTDTSLAPVALAFDPPPATLPLTQGSGKPGAKRGP